MTGDSDDANGSYKLLKQKIGKGIAFEDLKFKGGSKPLREATASGFPGIDKLRFDFDPQMAIAAFIQGNKLEVRTDLGQFDQANFAEDIQKKEFADLQRFWIKYDGLCDLICNYMLINGLLDKGVQDYDKTVFSASPASGTTVKLDLKREITLDNLQKSDVKKTHILDVTPFYKKLAAFFFREYPFNILSRSEQGNVVKKNRQNEYEANPDVVKQKLNGLENGAEIKFMAFKRSLFGFEGHSMLIKKVGDNNFIFFDPNHGLSQKLTADELVGKINEAMKENKANDIAFLDAKKFLHSLGMTAIPAETTQQTKDNEHGADDEASSGMIFK